MYDVVGIGAGPANLSLAALSEAVPDLSTRFFERQERLIWHRGLLFPDAELQVSFLKDLVTPVDPTNRYSFLSFLKQSGRLYRFLTCGFSRVHRIEFSKYLEWVAASLPSVALATPVIAVSYESDAFEVQTSGGSVRARNLVIGTGQTPHVPRFALPHLGSMCFHASGYLDMLPQTRGRHVALIGGGQSAAEIAHRMLSHADETPARLSWISNRPGLLPMDDSPFTNEYFFPTYAERFFALPRERRADLLQSQYLASDGISEGLLRQLYQRMYCLDHFDAHAPEYEILIETELDGLRRTSRGFQLDLHDLSSGERSILNADIVILATGYRSGLPACLAPIADRITIEGGSPIVNRDFSLQWAGSPSNRIFVQNGARDTHGVADPNLSLLAWRSATIINSILGRTVFELGNTDDVLSRSARQRTQGVDAPRDVVRRSAG